MLAVCQVVSDRLWFDPMPILCYVINPGNGTEGVQGVYCIQDVYKNTVEATLTNERE